MKIVTLLGSNLYEARTRKHYCNVLYILLAKYHSLFSTAILTDPTFKKLFPGNALSNQTGQRDSKNIDITKRYRMPYTSPSMIVYT